MGLLLSAAAPELGHGLAPLVHCYPVTETSYPMPDVKGSGQEEQPNVQGAVAAWVQEGGEELLHIQGQEGRL